MAIVVIDDERSFQGAQEDGREVIYLRTCAEALAYLETNTPITQLWFDHDLGEPDALGHTSVVPVVNLLLERAVWDNPYPVEQICVHTANTSGVDKIMSLERYYRCVRVNAVANKLVKP